MSIHIQNLCASSTIGQAQSVLNRRVKDNAIYWIKRVLEDVRSSLSTQSGIAQQQESTPSNRIHTDQLTGTDSGEYSRQSPGCFQTRPNSYVITLVLGLSLLFASGAKAKVFKADFDCDGLEDMAVGAPDEDIGNQKNAGAVTIIYNSKKGLEKGQLKRQFWHQNSPGIANYAEAGDRFGHALAVGDFNADACDDLAVGAPGESNSTSKSHGVVHVLFGSSTGLKGKGSKYIPAGQYGDPKTQFGAALAAGTIWGRDTIDDLAVGMPGYNKNTGGVIIFIGGRSGIGYDATGNCRCDPLFPKDRRVPGNGQAGSQFGRTLAVGDVTGDGRDNLVIGSPYRDFPSSRGRRFDKDDAGEVVVMHHLKFIGRNNGTLLRNAGRIESDDRFGVSLAVADFDGNGYADVAVGHPYEDIEKRGSTIKNAGAVTVFYSYRGKLRTSQPQLWTQESQMNGINVPDRSEEGDLFGYALTAADFTGDGKAELAIGIPFGENHLGGFRRNTLWHGWVLVLTGKTRGLAVPSRADWHQDISGVEGKRDAGRHFGKALSHGDFNRDGYPDLLVGVPGEVITDVAIRKQIGAGVVQILWGGGTSAPLVTGRKPKDPQRWGQATKGTTGDDAIEAYDLFGSVLP